MGHVTCDVYNFHSHCLSCPLPLPRHGTECPGVLQGASLLKCNHGIRRQQWRHVRASVVLYYYTLQYTVHSTHAIMPQTTRRTPCNAIPILSSSGRCFLVLPMYFKCTIVPQ